MNGFMISIVGFVIIAIYSAVILLIALFINRLTNPVIPLEKGYLYRRFSSCWKLYKLESLVIESQTGEVLGRETNFKRIFPTREALLAALLGPPIKLCPSPYPLPNINVGPYIPPPTLKRSVLKPISQQPEH